MHITVYCPHCQSRYQLDPTLRGKRMRCPNNLCRMVFEVREEGERRGVRPPMPEPQIDLGALTEAQSVAESEAPESSLRPEPDSEKTWDSKWEPPPIRREDNMGKRRGVTPPVLEPATASVREPAGLRRAARLMIVTMVIVLVGVLGLGIYWVKGKGAANEEERFKKAQELCQNQQFDEAKVAFQHLLRDFPSGKNRPQYDFLVEFSALRAAAYGPRDQPEERADALKNLLQFLNIYRNDPLLKDYHGDVWHTLQRLAGELTTLAEQKQEVHIWPTLNMPGRKRVNSRRRPVPAWTKSRRTCKRNSRAVQALLAAHAARLELLETLRNFRSQGTARAVRDGRIRADNAHLASDPEVKALLDELVERSSRQSGFHTGGNRCTDATPFARRGG